MILLLSTTDNLDRADPGPARPIQNIQYLINYSYDSISMFLILFGLSLLLQLIIWSVFVVESNTEAIVALFTIALFGATTYYAYVARNALRANVVDSVMKDYARDEILISMRKLRKFKNHFASDDEGRIRMNSAFIELEDTDIKKFDDLNQSRRMVSHHFQRIFRLRKTGVINDDLLRDFVTKQQAEFYLEIIEPLEGGKHNPNYIRESFNAFRDLYPELRKYHEIKWKGPGLATV